MRVPIALVEKPHCGVPPEWLLSCTSLPGLIGDNELPIARPLLRVPPPVPKGTLPPALFLWEVGGFGEGRMFWTWKRWGLEVVVPNSAL